MPPAFRADQVGSLLRPEKLLDARALHQRAPAESTNNHRTPWAPRSRLSNPEIGARLLPAMCP